MSPMTAIRCGGWGGGTVQSVRCPCVDRPLVALPAQPAGVEWPTGDWPEGHPVHAALDRLLDEAFDDTGPLARTYAVVAVRGGRLVRERYGGLDPRSGATAPVGPDTRLLSWSMAKSMV
jgi:hypothetical protein